MDLTAVSTATLQAELARRPNERVIDLPGLRVDPIASVVEFRGKSYELRPRDVELVYAMARERLRGRKRLYARELAHLVWSGFEVEAALSNLRVTIAHVHQQIPGLILHSGHRGLGYGLGIAEGEK